MDDCVFCKIAKGEIPTNKVYEDDEFLAFRDTNPQAPVHFLVIPKSHIQNVMEAKDSAFLGRLMAKASELAVKEGLGEKGFRLVINTKDDGGQTVPHLHVHVLGGRFMKWPPG